MEDKRVVLASGNAGKLREFSELLAAAGLVLTRQSDFGIAPFSILNGALQVQDRVDLRFRIHARRID